MPTSNLAPAAKPARATKPTAPPRHAAAIRVTNADRVIDAASGTTKGQLVAYSSAVSSLMLPHLRARPVALLRAPAGVGGAFFFQKHADADQLPELERLAPEIDPEHEPLLAIGTQRALLAAAQMNVVEFHTWNATTRAPDRPDRMVFDLDPGDGVAWPQLRDATLALRALLDELGLASFAKTSGGKGLHVVVPLSPRLGWDAVKGFSRAVVVHLADTLPQTFVARSGPKNRVGRIFVDYLRNGFGATTACAWSARARPGLGISVPIAWDELPALSGAAHWTVRNAAERLSVGNAPWAAYAGSRQGLAAAMKALGFDPRALPSQTLSHAADPQPPRRRS